MNGQHCPVADAHLHQSGDVQEIFRDPAVRHVKHWKALLAGFGIARREIDIDPPRFIDGFGCNGERVTNPE